MVFPEGSNEMGTPLSGRPQPRLYQDFLHQNAESPLIRPDTSTFSLLLPLASIIVLRTISNPLILQAIRSHEVARPYKSGLTCNLFVDFGSRKTNPKLSHYGAAVQTAVCSLLRGIGWLDRKKEEESFVQDCQSLFCHCSEPCPTFLPGGEQSLSGAEGLKAATALPSFCNFPWRLGNGWFPLNVPSQAAVLNNPGEWTRSKPGKQEPCGGWDSTNNKTGWINQSWLLASL